MYVCKKKNLYYIILSYIKFNSNYILIYIDALMPINAVSVSNSKSS